MFMRLFFILTLIPFIEIYLLLKIKDEIGFSNTLLLIFVTGFLGAYLLRQQGRSILLEIQKSQTSGQPPDDLMIKGLLTFIGGVLLITPGVLTDALGLSFIFYPTQMLWKHFLKKSFIAGIARGNIHVYSPTSHPFGVHRPGGPSRQRGVPPSFEGAPSEQVIDVTPKKSETFDQ